MKKIPLPRLSFKTVAGYFTLLLSMALLNFALPQHEPVSFALFFAALSAGLNPLVCGLMYPLASIASFSGMASLSAGVQAAFLMLIFVIYRRFGRRVGIERALYALLAQLPFIFLFPHGGYKLFPFQIVWQKVILSGAIFLLCLLFEGALTALLKRAFRCRLPAGRLAEISLLWLFIGLGLLSGLGEPAFYLVSLTAVLLSVLLVKNATAVPFSAVIALPLCLFHRSALPVAEFVLYASIPLLLSPYGKIATSLSLFLSFLVAQLFYGLYAEPVMNILFTVFACAIPALIAVCIPPRAYKKARRTLLFYRERTLPRIAINRNRRAIGEQLYEVSELFREIETAFDFQDPPDRAGAQLREKLVNNLCTGCQNRRLCERSEIFQSMDRLIAVGRAKGRVNLIDLPADISSACNNSAGLLFALNKHLGEYRKYSAELQAAREGRRLLAEQARGVSDILRDIALEQSEEYVFSDEEHALSSALAAAGILSSEIFLYGDGSRLTVSLTLENSVSGKKLASIASRALGVPLALAEKLPLSMERACYILKRKAEYDAAFGIAACPKDGETASGDTHSILRIDERRFMVALSDGMGSGEAARSVSDHTLSLLESFYKTRMPSETVLSTINRLIAFSAQETFSCLDLASVNLDTGTADVVKIGSPAGFVLSGRELRILEGESLPIGMLEAVHPATLRVEMKENDFLIFMSDGVTAAFGSSSELCAYLSRLHPLNPQSLAEEILKNAIGRYHGRAEDDMTVLTVKLTKSA